MMKKQQWMMFKQVFSMINYSSSSRSSIISIFNNNVLLRPRPFCCSTTTTTTTTTTPLVSNNKKHELNMLLEKKHHPLLLVPYDHITPKEYVLCPPKPNRAYEDRGDYHLCDGTFGFINLFFHDDDDQQLVINNKKKKEVYDVYVPEIAKRRICGSSEGWLVTVHWNGEFQLLNPVTRAIVHLPPFTTLSTDFPPPPRNPSYVKKVVTNTTTTNSTTLPAAVANTEVVVMAIQGDSYGSLSFCRTSTLSSSSTGNGTTDETTAAWMEIPVKIPMSAGLLTLSDQEEYSNHPDHSDDEEEHPEIITYEVIDGVTTHWVTKLSGWADVTFYKGNFYTVGHYGMVGVVKGLDGPSPFVQYLIDFDHPKENKSHICYLVESSSSSSSSGGGCGGDLLMVMRNVVADGQETEVLTDKTETYRTNGFRVLKLNLNGPNWEEVTDLGEDCALFVGYNHSFSLSASKIPGCRGNCIYFTDGHHDYTEGLGYPNGGHDIGVYKLEDASFEKLDYETCSSQLIMPPPVWYVPN